MGTAAVEETVITHVEHRGETKKKPPSYEGSIMAQQFLMRLFSFPFPYSRRHKSNRLLSLCSRSSCHSLDSGASYPKPFGQSPCSVQTKAHAPPLVYRSYPFVYPLCERTLLVHKVGYEVCLIGEVITLYHNIIVADDNSRIAINLLHFDTAINLLSLSHKFI